MRSTWIGLVITATVFLCATQIVEAVVVVAAPSPESHEPHAVDEPHAVEEPHPVNEAQHAVELEADNYRAILNRVADPADMQAMASTCRMVAGICREPAVRGDAYLRMFARQALEYTVQHHPPRDSPASNDYWQTLEHVLHRSAHQKISILQALLASVRHCHVDIFQFLVDRIDPELFRISEESEDFLVMMIRSTIRSPCPEIFRRLVGAPELGIHGLVDISQRADHIGTELLLETIEQDRAEMCQALIQAGARDIQHMALWDAALAQRAEILTLLLESFPDYTHRNVYLQLDLQDPLQLEVLCFLLLRTEFHGVDLLGDGFLLAAEVHRADIVQWLLDYPAFDEGPWLYRAALRAIMGNSVETFALLTMRHPQLLQGHGSRFLYRAILQASKDMVRYLLQRGVNPGSVHLIALNIVREDPVFPELRQLLEPPVPSRPLQRSARRHRLYDGV